MTLPAIDTLCDALETFEFDLCLTIPGGAEICAMPETFPPSLVALSRSLLTAASGALAPMRPIFDIIETIAAILECIEAVPAAITELDPSGITDCVPNLTKQVEKLLALLPPASLFAVLVGILDALITILQGMIRELRAVERLIVRITSAKFIGTEALQSIIDCGEGTVVSSMTNIERLFASLNAIITIYNTLAGLAGLPEIPEFGGVGLDPTPIIDVLDDLIEILQGVRDAIPL